MTGFSWTELQGSAEWKVAANPMKKIPPLMKFNIQLLQLCD